MSALTAGVLYPWKQYSSYIHSTRIVSQFSKFFHIFFEYTLGSYRGITILDVFSIGLKVLETLMLSSSVLKVGPITSPESPFPDPGIFWGRATLMPI